MAYELNDNLLWQDYVDAYRAYKNANMVFTTQVTNRVAVIQQALLRYDRNVAIDYMNIFTEDELKLCISELLFLASFVHGAIATVRNLILRISKAWLIENMERYTEPLLSDDDPDIFHVYCRILELYEIIDNDLAYRFALRAINHADIEIQEAGRDSLKRLKA